jgi:MerR family redox-sensitive transcriptional activator SoxR
LKSTPKSVFLPAVTDWLSIGEVAARSGVAASALRFYEAEGLIRAERTPAGHRRYPRAVLRRVAFIVYAQRIGLALEEIRHELSVLPEHGAPTRGDWARLSAGWDARIAARIAELERLRASLTECIGCGCLSLDRCALANPGDRAAALGPGPRRWVAPERGLPPPAVRTPSRTAVEVERGRHRSEGRRASPGEAR